MESESSSLSINLVSRISASSTSSSIGLNDIAEKNESLLKYLNDNDTNIIIFFQLTGFIFTRFPGQSWCAYISSSSSP
jgi:hypothetical protein